MDVTVCGPNIVEGPRSLVDQKPIIETFSNVQYLSYDVNLPSYPPINTDERVRIGVLNNLSHEGFKKLEIEHLKGDVHDIKKGIFRDSVIVVGQRDYYYVDIEW